MSDEQVLPADFPQLTSSKDIRQMPATEYKKWLKHENAFVRDSFRAKVNQILSEPMVVPQPEAAPVPEVIPESTPQPVVEVPPVVPEPLAVPEPPPAPRKKIVLDYQATDDDGRPIGHRTHLEAWSHEEMIEKQKNAHIQATRAFERLKKRQVSKVVIEPVKQPTEEEQKSYEAVLKDVKSDDPVAVAEAVRKLVEEELRKKEEREAAYKAEYNRQQEASKEFLRTYPDYNNCAANNQMLAAYITENKLRWTADNLAIAYEALEAQLAPKEIPAPEPEPEPEPAQPSQPEANPPVAATPAPEPAPSTPVTVEEPTPAPVDQQTPRPNVPAAPARRPGVDGSLQPGQTRVSQPVRIDPNAITFEKIKKMSPDEYKKALKDPARRAEIERAIARHNALKSGTK